MVKEQQSQRDTSEMSPIETINFVKDVKYKEATRRLYHISTSDHDYVEKEYIHNQMNQYLQLN